MFRRTSRARRTPTPPPLLPHRRDPAYCQGRDDDAVEARITDLLRALSLEEKTAMMAGAGISLVEGELAGARPRQGLRVPGLRMLDGPRGLSAMTRLRATAFPWP